MSTAGQLRVLREVSPENGKEDLSEPEWGRRTTVHSLKNPDLSAEQELINLLSDLPISKLKS